MGQSIETRVRVVKVEHVFKHPELTYVENEDYPDEHYHSPLSDEAHAAIKDAESGDIVEVIWDYDIEGPGYTYPIIQARRITGSLEERVEKLESLVASLMEGKSNG